MAKSRWSVLAALLLLAACQVQWVSPYSADLQKRATDMLADVVAWETTMRSSAGTAAADPRNPAVQAKLAAWRGSVEAMAQVELGIDPGATACDSFLSRISGALTDLKQRLPNAPSLPATALTPITYCESLPHIFERMERQVSGDTPDGYGIPFLLDQQCKLPWLSDDYFTALKSGTAPAKPPAPTPQQQTQATLTCRALFQTLPGSAHGPAVSSLITQLDAVIYRETRQAPTTGK
jgi:hypothetical protein